jgi:hypothetical protein
MNLIALEFSKLSQTQRGIAYSVLNLEQYLFFITEYFGSVVTRRGRLNKIRIAVNTNIVEKNVRR